MTGNLSFKPQNRIFLIIGIWMAAWLSAFSTFAVENTMEWATRIRFGHTVNNTIENAIDNPATNNPATNNANHDNGQAASILLRGNIRSDWSEYFQTFLEVDHVSTAFQDQHSDGERFNRQPLIPDPPGTEINQLWLESSWPLAKIRLGRQRIDFDDGRFIGGDGFWQNEQTFDALRLKHNWGSASSIDYVYIGNVNRIYGQGADGKLSDWILKRYAHNAGSAIFWGDHQHRTHLLHLHANEWDKTKLSAFIYAIDNLDWAPSSNNTIGTRYQHFSAVGAVKIDIEAVLAAQNRPDITSSPQPKYGTVALGAGYNAWRAVARFENLGDDKSIGFATPLASLNNFQGWAEEFITTPSGGIEDSSLQLNWRRSPWEVDVRFHQFNSSDSSIAFGQELDFELTLKPKKDHKIRLRYAQFNGQQEAWSDSTKMYLDYSYHLK